MKYSMLCSLFSVRFVFNVMFPEVGTSQETEDSSSAACSAPPTDEEERQSAKSFVKSLLQALTHLLNIEYV